MKFTVVTLFPQLIESFAQAGLVGQGASKGSVEIKTLNPRQFTTDVHQSVDDTVYGGSDGMLMKFEPLAKAIESLRAEGPVRVAVLTPQGRVWSQAEAEAWADHKGHIALVCGRYAGIDHRFSVAHADEEISIGDYILNGGEIAACAIMESVVRLLPGVLGNAVSGHRDTFNGGLLECPQFTRPREIAGLQVPSVLLSGHHQKIAEFEASVSRVRTALFRPDLLDITDQLTDDIRRLKDLPDPELNALGLTRDTLSDLEQL